MKLRFAVLIAYSVTTSHSWALVLFNNATPAGLTGEGFRTRPRPGGGDYSEVQAGNIGIAASFRQWTFKIADDFIVDSPWKVNKVVVWGFQPGLDTPSITTGWMEIRAGTHDGPAVAVGSLSSVSMTDIYRIFNNRPDDERQVQKLIFNLRAKLVPGRYWVVFNALGVYDVDGPQSPFLTRVGQQTTLGANAKSQVAAWTLEWHEIYDPATFAPQDIPFWIDGQRLSQIGPVLE